MNILVIVSDCVSSASHSSSSTKSRDSCILDEHSQEDLMYRDYQAESCEMKRTLEQSNIPSDENSIVVSKGLPLNTAVSDQNLVATSERSSNVLSTPTDSETVISNIEFRLKTSDYSYETLARTSDDITSEEGDYNFEERIYESDEGLKNENTFSNDGEEIETIQDNTLISDQEDKFSNNSILIEESKPTDARQSDVDEEFTMINNSTTVEDSCFSDVELTATNELPKIDSKHFDCEDTKSKQNLVEGSQNICLKETIRSSTYHDALQQKDSDKTSNDGRNVHNIQEPINGTSIGINKEYTNEEPEITRKEFEISKEIAEQYSQINEMVYPIIIKENTEIAAEDETIFNKTKYTGVLSYADRDSEQNSIIEDSSRAATVNDDNLDACAMRERNLDASDSYLSGDASRGYQNSDASAVETLPKHENISNDTRELRNAEDNNKTVVEEENTPEGNLPFSMPPPSGMIETNVDAKKEDIFKNKEVGMGEDNLLSMEPSSALVETYADWKDKLDSDSIGSEEYSDESSHIFEFSALSVGKNELADCNSPLIAQFADDKTYDDNSASFKPKLRKMVTFQEKVDCIETFEPLDEEEETEHADVNEKLNGEKEGKEEIEDEDDENKTILEQKNEEENEDIHEEIIALKLQTSEEVPIGSLGLLETEMPADLSKLSKSLESRTEIMNVSETVGSKETNIELSIGTESSSETRNSMDDVEDSESDLSADNSFEDEENISKMAHDELEEELERSLESILEIEALNSCVQHLDEMSNNTELTRLNNDSGSFSSNNNVSDTSWNPKAKTNVMSSINTRSVSSDSHISSTYDMITSINKANDIEAYEDEGCVAMADIQGSPEGFFSKFLREGSLLCYHYNILGLLFQVSDYFFEDEKIQGFKGPTTNMYPLKA